MNMQAWIGQASFNCYLGPYVWVKCADSGCERLRRVLRERHKEGPNVYCSYQCFRKRSSHV